MASACITSRVRAGGKTYVVRYRLAGRAYPLVHARSFRTLKEAKLRRDLVAGELAAGRDPALLLAAMTSAPAPAPGLAARWAEFSASRVDVGEKAQAQYRN